MKKTLASMFLALLLAPVVMPSTAEARPCCQTCDGWNDGEPPIGYDYCWDNCYICSSGGWECTNNAQCSGPLYECVGGWCVFVGTEPFSADEADPEAMGAQCLNGVSNADGSETCFDLAS